MQNDMINQLNQLRNNPIEFVVRRGFNLPNAVSADPNSIIRHLMNTGQVSQNQYNNAMGIVNQFINGQR